MIQIPMRILTESRKLVSALLQDMGEPGGSDERATASAMAAAPGGASAASNRRRRMPPCSAPRPPCSASGARSADCCCCGWLAASLSTSRALPCRRRASPVGSGQCRASRIAYGHLAARSAAQKRRQSGRCHHISSWVRGSSCLIQQELRGSCWCAVSDDAQQHKVVGHPGCIQAWSWPVGL